MLVDSVLTDDDWVMVVVITPTQFSHPDGLPVYVGYYFREDVNLFSEKVRTFISDEDFSTIVSTRVLSGASLAWTEKKDYVSGGVPVVFLGWDEIPAEMRSYAP